MELVLPMYNVPPYFCPQKCGQKCTYSTRQNTGTFI